MAQMRSFLMAAMLVAVPSAGLANWTLSGVQLRDELSCGVAPSAVGFSETDDAGNRRGLDVDICRAVAAAVLGDANQVDYVELSNADRFEALQYGEIDVLIRNTTWTFTRDTTLDITFTGIAYFDGQGFLVQKALGVETLADLAGKRICFKSATTHEKNLKSYAAHQGFTYEGVAFDEADLAVLAFQNGRCDALTSDQSELFGIHSTLPDPDLSEVIPLLISKEPLGPSVRKDDPAWADIVRWTLFTLIAAEELGITQSNVDAMKNSDNPAVQSLLNGAGVDDFDLELPKDWPATVIAQVGNYGEIFDRNLGNQSPIGIERGLNALWNNGGLMYAPPFR